MGNTVYPKKYAHGSCFAVLCCGYILTDLPISIRLTSLALWQSNDCPSASKATLVNMGKCIMWIHYEWLHNHNKAKHNKTVGKFLGIYCRWIVFSNSQWCRRRHKGILLWNICRHDRHLFPSRERHRLHQCTRLIPALRPANERRRYNVTRLSIDWAQA